MLVWYFVQGFDSEAMADYLSMLWVKLRLNQMCYQESDTSVT